jgi:hypothetical protein
MTVADSVANSLASSCLLLQIASHHPTTGGASRTPCLFTSPFSDWINCRRPSGPIKSPLGYSDQLPLETGSKIRAEKVNADLWSDLAQGEAKIGTVFTSMWIRTCPVLGRVRDATTTPLATVAREEEATAKCRPSRTPHTVLLWLKTSRQAW